MTKLRIIIVFAFFAIFGCAIFQQQSESILSSESLALWASKPFLNLAGLFKKGTDSTIEDERLLGIEILKSFDLVKRDKILEKKLNLLNDKLTKAHNPKNLKWKVIVIEYGFNASAYPGGVIVISKKLVQALKKESYIVAILAHERGHIDLGHCYNYYKSKSKLGRLIYSKLQEEQADDYSFEFLIRMGYDPIDLSNALTIIKDTSPQQDQYSIYKSWIFPPIFESHPTLSFRILQQKQKAKTRSRVGEK